MNTLLKRLPYVALIALFSFHVNYAAGAQEGMSPKEAVNALIIVETTSTAIVVQIPQEESPFKRAAIALDEMIKNISPKANMLNRMEQELQRHCLSAAAETKDYRSLLTLARIKSKLTGVFSIFLEPGKQFIKQVRESRIFGASTCSETMLDQTVPATMPSEEFVTRIDALCEKLFKSHLESAVLSLVFAACDVTESELTALEHTELTKLAHSFGVIARHNIAKSFSISELDELIKFCNSPLFDKLRSNLPLLAKTVIDTFTMDQMAKERIYKLLAKSCA
ncbi:MAG: hypothetical protein WCT20_02475 [Candidatus Babeliales bacterium]|jgi:hypothetical protein